MRVRTAAALILAGLGILAVVVQVANPVCCDASDVLRSWLVSGPIIVVLSVLAVAVWRDWRLGWLGTVILGGLLAFLGLDGLIYPLAPLTAGFLMLAGLALLAAALIRFWPAIRRRRMVLFGLALIGVTIVAWGTVRFVAPFLLGLPTVTCGPEMTPAGCPNWQSAVGPREHFLLPMTEVTIVYGDCETRVRIRYLGGSEDTINWLC